jgi:CheY-like chemotaxis protein
VVNKIHKILVVDDLPDWRNTISGVLTDEGYQVEMAASTPEALGLLHHSHFDLAILDMRLDESDENNTEGLDILAKEIRKSWPDVKAIILTGYGTPETQKRALEPDIQGQRLVEDFVEKTETEGLVQTVKRVLAQ